MTKPRTTLDQWVRHTSECLVEAAAPRRENPVYALLVRRWRSNLHRAPDWTLRGAVLLALLSVLLLPTAMFSFAIWHALLAGFVLWPALRFPYDLRRGRGGVVDLLMTPVTSGRYVQALRRIFCLSALYAAIPYAIYWLALFGLRRVLMPGLYSNWPDGAVVASAVLYLAALMSLLWLALWCAVAGGWWILAPVLITPLAVAAYVTSPARVFGTEPFPVSPALWLAVLNFFIFGHLISRMLARKFVGRMRELT